MWSACMRFMSSTAGHRWVRLSTGGQSTRQRTLEGSLASNLFSMLVCAWPGRWTNHPPGQHFGKPTLCACVRLPSAMHVPADCSLNPEPLHSTVPPVPVHVCLQGFLALFSGDTGEIRSEVREQIDAKVCWCVCAQQQAAVASSPWGSSHPHNPATTSVCQGRSGQETAALRRTQGSVIRCT
jgi:hypothetical protein